MRFFILVTFSLLLAGCLRLTPQDKSTLSIQNDRSYTYNDCIHLKAIKIADDGDAMVFFERKDAFTGYQNYYEECHRALVSGVETQPDGAITGFEGINPDGSFPYGSFYLKVKPNTHSLRLATIDQNGSSIALDFLLDNFIEQAQIIADQSNWMQKIENHQPKLIEREPNDDSAPIIEFLDRRLAAGKPLFVEKYTTIIKGRVRDNTGVMTVTISGKKARLKEDGTFVSKVNLKVGQNNFVVQAEDINNNISSARFTIVRKEFIPKSNLADVDIPPKTRMDNPNALAVVIGIENYQYVPDATFAYNDAEVFREYLAETMGFKRERIKIVTNNKATQAELDKLLGPEGWLARNIIANKSDVIVFFSGHGINALDASSSGLLPHDVDPNYSIGIRTNELYQNLSAMGAKSVAVYLDACFSGQTRNSEMLVKNARPIIIEPTKTSLPPNLIVFSAASGLQISGALEEKKHGLFTYFLLKGLGGDADINSDKKVEISELRTFVVEKVNSAASLIGHEQTPELQGHLEGTLVEYQ